MSGRRLGPLLLVAAMHAQAAPAPAPAPAAIETPPQPLFDPGSWPAGEWSLTPQLGVAAGYDDNLRLQPVGLASPFIAVRPELAATRTRGDDSLEIDLRADWTHYTASPDDDTADTEVSAAGLDVLGAHTAASWNIAAQDGHDAIGLPSADAVAQSPDHFHAIALGAVLRHDSDDAGTRRLELEPTVSARKYLNHRELTAEADADTASLVGRYLLAYAPGRRLGPELRLVRTAYPAGDENLSDTDARALATLRWDASGAVSGTASLGGQRRWFDAARRDYSGVAWDADAQWQCGPRTQLSLATERAAGEAPGEDVDEVVARRVSVVLGHDWSASWHGSLSASTTGEHYVGAPASRDDHVQSLGLDVRRDLSRTWRLSLDLGWTRRHSAIDAFDFTRRSGSLELRAAI